MPPQKRNVGFVFQHYAVFKHMTVAKNVAFGLEIRKRPKDEIAARVDELLKLVHLSQFSHRLPSQLSGGQRQRMALARALAVEPTVLLLDEPFGALDAKVRKELREWLRRLHDEVAVTTVFVTHDRGGGPRGRRRDRGDQRGPGRAGRLARPALRRAGQRLRHGLPWVRSPPRVA
ncbi:ATP-binding cassette domain-containing protein [Nocardioides sp. B-3]|nr:ATP-binding cassette domain-containing protein [Nocardioides sp. B-3]UUZ60729.1 ATP-binding cassette domain-containing protein [Nocardioides sp. B-3]